MCSMKFTPTLLVFLAAPLLLGVEGKADAQNKAPCGLTYAPFAKGNTWTYEFMVPPGVEEKAGLKVNAPDQIKITARGDKLHVFTDGHWLIYDIASLDYD